ncbi:MAG: glycoside hydrolase domain-containing protein [Phycisphaeraceae bacterium]
MRWHTWRYIGRTLLLATVAAFITATPQTVAANDLEVWRSDIHDPTDSPAGDGAAAVELAGTRNGAFSGKIVVSAAEALTGLKATASDLRHGSAVIPADAVRVRYAAPSDRNITGHNVRPTGNDVLLDAPPAGQSKVPVWVTVRVPADAAAGAYVGELTVTAAGVSPVRVPVQLEVADWTLPDTQDYRTWIELLQSPDTLAMEYDVPMWSEEHWELIARSLELIGKTGSRVLYIPLICHTNMGNDESMVRWSANGGGAFEHDYAIMDRYLDLAEEHMGTPKLVVFFTWDVYLVAPDEEPVVDENASRYQQTQQRRARDRWELRNEGVPVTMLDAATGDARTGHVPRYTQPEGQAPWQALWDGLRERMRERGLQDTMMLGLSTDMRPTREQVTTLHKLSGGLPWASVTHHAQWLEQGANSSGRKAMHGIADIGYTVAALGYMRTINPAIDRSYAWQQDGLHGRAIFWRFSWFNSERLSTIRHEPEANITGNQRGVAHLGGDFWYVIEDRRGRRRATIAAPSRHPQSHWRSLNIEAWMLAPGPEGAVPTARYMVFREGIQECEARIAIEAVLTDSRERSRLGDALADRAQAVLDERHLAIWRARGGSEEDLQQHGLMTAYRDIYQMIDTWDEDAGHQWFTASGWAQRTGELFGVAGEVQQRAGR